MPEGSSSLAPVTRPGPSSFQKRLILFCSFIRLFIFRFFLLDCNTKIDISLLGVFHESGISSSSDYSQANLQILKMKIA